MAFGHSGAKGQIAAADPATGVSYSYMTNGLEQALAEVVKQLIESGELGAALFDRQAPLGFLENHDDVASIVQAAYRFCRHEPGATVVLTGTGSEDHLRENIESILTEPLPGDVMLKLDELFGSVNSVSGN